MHCVLQISEDEKVKEVKGPRANNYGVASNAPPDNPSKCVHMLDVEDIQVREAVRSHICHVFVCFFAVEMNIVWQSLWQQCTGTTKSISGADIVFVLADSSVRPPEKLFICIVR